jgi:tRNA-dihydrouridine synthase B
LTKNAGLKDKFMLKIGPFQNPSKIVIAPMAGVTDQPFRNLCRRKGAFWVVSEMVTSDQRLWHTSKSSHRLQFGSEAEPRWVQIAGADPDMLAEAAISNERLGAQIIDINMGCPAKKVCRKAAGSALMRDEKLVQQILEKVVKAVSVPVTLKIRLGWSPEEQNATKIARIAQDAGIHLLSVHGRTKACKFGGNVNYDAIAEVVEAVDIPVIANGDIGTAEKAAWVLTHTGAAGIMIGRAAQGQPWLASQIDYYLKTKIIEKNPSLGEIKSMLMTHIVDLSQFYGEVMGPRIARKHVGWYFAGLIGNEDTIGFTKRFNGLNQVSEQIEAIESVFLAMQKREEIAA